MSTQPADVATALSPMHAIGAGTLFGRLGKIWSALREGKAASDRYESLISRGAAPDQAARVVFREHFNRH